MQSIDSMQCPSKSQYDSSQTLKRTILNFIQKSKNPGEPKQSCVDGFDSVKTSLGCFKIQQQGLCNSEEDAWHLPHSGHTKKAVSKMRLLYNVASEFAVDMIFQRLLRTYIENSRKAQSQDKDEILNLGLKFTGP